MKKNLFVGFIALTALTVTSCTNDEVVEAIPQKQAIEFGTYLGRDAQSRAAELNNSGLQTNGFGVFASYTEEEGWAANKVINYMYNQKVTYSSPLGWTYSPKKYWPTNQGDKISFWAYAPYATTNTNNGITMKTVAGGANVPVLTYTLTTENLATQADLTTDVAMNVTNGATINPDGSHRTIDFTLRHELTRVAISAQLDKDIDSNTKVNIKNITLGGANFVTKADYTFASTTDGKGTWTPDPTTTGKTTLSLENILDKKTASDLGTYNVKGVFLTDDSPVKLFGDDNFLFLIPFADGFDSGTITMTIDYDIVTKDAAFTTDQHVKTSATKIITLPTNQDLFTQGSAYQFNLKFYMNEIVLSAGVDGTWGSGSYDTNVDWNDEDPKDPS